MSADTTPGKGSDEPDSQPVTRELIARMLVLAYEENPEELIEMGMMTMLATGNVTLSGHVERFASAYKQTEGEESARSFKQGVALVFLYAAEVAEDIDHTPLLVVTDSIIETVRQGRLEDKKHRTIASEFLDNKALDEYRFTRIKDKHDEIDSALTMAMGLIMHNQVKNNLPPGPKAAFISGALMTWDLLQAPPPSSPRK